MEDLNVTNDIFALATAKVHLSCTVTIISHYDTQKEVGLKFEHHKLIQIQITDLHASPNITLYFGH